MLFRNDLPNKSHKNTLSDILRKGRISNSILSFDYKNEFFMRFNNSNLTEYVKKNWAFELWTNVYMLPVKGGGMETIKRTTRKSGLRR